MNFPGLILQARPSTPYHLDAIVLWSTVAFWALDRRYQKAGGVRPTDKQLHYFWLACSLWGVLILVLATQFPTLFEGPVALLVAMATLPIGWHFYRWRIRKANPINSSAYPLLAARGAWKMLRKLTKGLGVFLLGLLAMAFDAFVLYVLYDWFLSTVFNVSIGFFQMMGIRLFAGVLAGNTGLADQNRFELLVTLIEAAVPNERKEHFDEVAKSRVEVAAAKQWWDAGTMFLTKASTLVSGFVIKILATP